MIWPVLLLPPLLAAAAGWGWWILRALGMFPSHRDPWHWLLALALGMGGLGHLVLGVGLAGWLQPPVLAALVAAGWLLLGLARPWTGKAPPEEEPPVLAGSARLGTVLLVALLALAAVATLFSALKPVDALDWDSLSYHLAAPKLYLRAGRIYHIAYDSHTNFPFTLEMLYTLGLAFGGPGLAKTVHWACGWLTAAAIGLWVSRQRVQGAPPPPWAGPLAGGLFAAMPVVLWEMGTAYVDLGTALFQFLALAVLLEGCRRPEPPHMPSVLLAGVLTGFALGTKYTALIQWGLLGLGLLFLLARGPHRPAVVRATLGFGVASLLVAAPWYVKNWLWVHNPVYPFLYSLFPQSFSWSQEAADGYAREQQGFGRRQTEPLGSLWSLWDLAFHGRDFFVVARSLTGDKLGSLGAAWAGLVPLALYSRGLPGSAWAMLLYSGASIGFWWFLSQQSRYLMPVFAPLAAAVMLAVVALGPGLLRNAATGFATLCVVLGLWLHMPLATNAFLVVSGVYGEKEYLAATLGSLHEATEYVNTLPEDSRVALYQETRAFYFERDYFWANPGQHQMIRYAELQDGDHLVSELRRFRITHVLVNYDFTDPAAYQEVPWYRLLMDAIRRGRLQPAFAGRGAEPPRRGIVVYRLD